MNNTNPRESINSIMIHEHLANKLSIKFTTVFSSRNEVTRLFIEHKRVSTSAENCNNIRCFHSVHSFVGYINPFFHCT